MKLLKPWLEKKKVSLKVVYIAGLVPAASDSLLDKDSSDRQKLALDSWGCDRTPVNDMFKPLHKWMLDAAPSLEKRYPSQWKGYQHVDRVIRQCLLSVSEWMSHEAPRLTTKDELCAEYASYFEGKSMEELDALAKSFALSKFHLMARHASSQLTLQVAVSSESGSMPPSPKTPSLEPSELLTIDMHEIAAMHTSVIVRSRRVWHLSAEVGQGGPNCCEGQYLHPCLARAGTEICMSVELP
jgi:hypothetical protein